MTGYQYWHDGCHIGCIRSFLSSQRRQYKQCTLQQPPIHSTVNEHGVEYSPFTITLYSMALYTEYSYVCHCELTSRSQAARLRKGCATCCGRGSAADASQHAKPKPKVEIQHRSLRWCRAISTHSHPGERSQQSSRQSWHRGLSSLVCCSVIPGHIKNEKHLIHIQNPIIHACAIIVLY